MEMVIMKDCARPVWNADYRSITSDSGINCDFSIIDIRNVRIAINCPIPIRFPTPFPVYLLYYQ